MAAAGGDFAGRFAAKTLAKVLPTKTIGSAIASAFYGGIDTNADKAQPASATVAAAPQLAGRFKTLHGKQLDAKTLAAVSMSRSTSFTAAKFGRSRLKELLISLEEVDYQVTGFLAIEM